MIPLLPTGVNPSEPFSPPPSAFSAKSMISKLEQALANNLHQLVALQSLCNRLERYKKSAEDHTRFLFLRSLISHYIQIERCLRKIDVALPDSIRQIAQSFSPEYAKGLNLYTNDYLSFLEKGTLSLIFIFSRWEYITNGINIYNKPASYEELIDFLKIMNSSLKYYGPNGKSFNLIHNHPLSDFIKSRVCPYLSKIDKYLETYPKTFSLPTMSEDALNNGDISFSAHTLSPNDNSEPEEVSPEQKEKSKELESSLCQAIQSFADKANQFRTLFEEFRNLLFLAPYTSVAFPVQPAHYGHVAFPYLAIYPQIKPRANGRTHAECTEPSNPEL